MKKMFKWLIVFTIILSFATGFLVSGCKAATVATTAAETTSTAAETTAAKKEIAPAPEKETYDEFLKRVGGEEFLYAPVKGDVIMGLIGITKEHEYQKRRDVVAKATADLMGVNLLMDVYENDVTIQRKRSEDMVTKGAKAIITTSRDNESFTALADFLKQSNVYLCAEGGTNDAFTRKDYPNYIGVNLVPSYQNGFDGGAWAAKYFKETYPDKKAKIVIVNYTSVPIAIERANGFIDGFKSVVSDAEILFNDNAGSGAGRDEVLPDVENLFTKYTEMNIFFSIWDEPAMAAYTAAKARGLTNKELMIVGYDGTIEVAEIIKKGDLIVEDIGQNPELAGKFSVAACARVISGDLTVDQVPLYLNEPGFLINPETVDEFLKMVK